MKKLQLYKGYVKTKGKVPVDKFKGGKGLRTLEEVENLPEYAGILADDVIVFDFDDQKQSEIMMQIVEDLQLDCIVRQTSRGRHFLFKNSAIDSCGAHKKLACGLTADIKVGKNNSTQQLKIDGEERFIEWECDEPHEAPKWLFPVNSNVDFFKLEEGDGRNSTLYSYILTLTNAGFSKEESRETIEIINKYILADPLSEDEIETITRDEAFPAEVFYQGKAFLHNNFAQFLLNNDHILRINGQLHIYRNGVYVPGRREIESIMVKHLPMMKAAQREEVLKYLEIICPDETKTADASLISFNNGVYDVVHGVLLDFSPEIVITNKIPWEFDQAAYSELADKVLNKIACNDKAIRAVLEESIGYSMYRRNELSKAFFLTGEGSNGKSTFLDMLGNVVGEENKSSLGLEELDERFSIATLSNKLINTGDDISDDFLQGRAIANFKKVVSGNEVKAEYKGQDAFFMKPYTKLFFSANSLPRTRSKGFEAIKRRLVIIPFNARFSKHDLDYDPYIIWKLREPDAMKYLIQIGIAGLKRVLENNDFTQSKKVEKELQDYEVENNPILLFLQEKETSDIVNQPTRDIHKAYKVFCVENGFTEMNLSTFSKEICKRLGLAVKRQRVNGVQVGIYVKEGKL